MTNHTSSFSSTSPRPSDHDSLLPAVEDGNTSTWLREYLMVSIPTADRRGAAAKTIPDTCCVVCVE